MSRAQGDCFIHPTAIIDQPMRWLTGCKQSQDAPNTKTNMPTSCYIGAYCVIGCGAVLGERVILESYISIEPGAIIGEDTLLIYRSTIGGGVTIGPRCVIGGFIPENTSIGADCRILGTLTHLHNDPAMDWDHHVTPEAAPTIEDNVFVGLGALVVGGVKLGRKSYVCAGATVKSDVPAFHIVSRSGDIIHQSDWKGKLKDSAFFRE